MKTSADHPALTDRRRGLIFLCLVVSGIASSTLSTAMTTALPNLVTDFGVSTAVGQWVTSGYSLAMGVILPLTAFLITRLPTRRLYLTGIAAFIAGLLLSIFAGNFTVMMVGRVLQACANGLLMSAAQVIILTVYPQERRGAMMGTYGLATTAAPIVAPTIAGLLIDAFGWKSIFTVVLAIMAAGAALNRSYQPLAMRLSAKYNKIWVAAELALFVLVGAAVDPAYALKAGAGVAVLVALALLFRMGGVWLSVAGTRLTGKERLFAMLAYTPKATVQAAIGSVPLAMGLSCGSLALTAAVVAILLTAPFGAIAIDLTAGKLLTQEAKAAPETASA